MSYHVHEGGEIHMTTANMTLEERLDFIEFRQELLFYNGPYDRLLFDHDVTREQRETIADIFDDYRKKIDAGEDVGISATYEQKIYEAVPHKHGNYHFAEDLAHLNHQRGSWEEVFEALYGDSPKFQNYLNNRNED